MADFAATQENTEPPVADLDIDGFIDKMVAAGKGWSDEQRKKYCDDIGEHPLFADSYEEMNQEYAEAIKNVVYDDQTPYELAEYCKEQGNKSFIKGSKNKVFYKNALKFYQDALTHVAQCSVEEGEEDWERVRRLESVLWANSANVHLNVRNYATVRQQCARALEAWPGNVKAHYRLAKAHLGLRRAREALAAAGAGLALEPGNAQLAGVARQAEQLIQVQEAKKKAAEAKRAAAAAAAGAIWDRARRVGARLGHSGFLGAAAAPPALPAPDPDPPQGPAATGEPSWVWPVLWMYPEHRQTDFVPQMGEDEMLALRMSQMFPEEGEGDPPGWDTKGEYRCSNLEVYLQTCTVDALESREEYLQWYKAIAPEAQGSAANLEYKETLENDWKTRHGHWVRLHPACTLRQVLAVEGHVVAGSVVVLTAFPRGGAAHAGFLKV